ncbi:hypothetical protein [Actinoallomurus sp. CA-142502]|uniref:hypothetical protein n=1 Tax=Actinoallomurus sp. CA-142502 TaxID=3239885 RepID=UPI003D8C1114
MARVRGSTGRRAPVRRRRPAACAIAAPCVASAVVTGTAADAVTPRRQAYAAPAVWPAPQSTRAWSRGFPLPSSLRLAAGADADAAAVGLVRWDS